MTTEQQVKSILVTKFPSVYVTAALKHFSEAVGKYQRGDWEGSLLKIGKFVEAVTKCLYIYCGQSLPPTRRFKVGVIVKNLEQLGNYDDTVRILIPKACVFIYDIANNRGARHDPEGIDPNKMDASVAIPIVSWVLAELVRFADGKADLKVAMLLVEGLSTKKYPYFEDIDGRTYINLKGLSARDVGLLILNAIYPKRITREQLIDMIHRHNFSKNSARVATQRLKGSVDDDNDNWKLRGIGLQEAEKMLGAMEH
jgi:hypothetical protein